MKECTQCEGEGTYFTTDENGMKERYCDRCEGEGFLNDNE